MIGKTNEWWREIPDTYIYILNTLYNYININVTRFLLSTNAKQSLHHTSQHNQSTSNDMQKFPSTQNFFLSTLAFLRIIIKNIYILKFAARKTVLEFHFPNAQRIVLQQKYEKFRLLLLILEFSIIRYRYLATFMLYSDSA